MEDINALICELENYYGIELTYKACRLTKIMTLQTPNEFRIKPYLWAVGGGFFGPVAMDVYDPFTG